MSISPAPWKVSGTREVYSDGLPKEECVIAFLIDGNDEDGELIAAAPELLAALKEIVAYDEGSFSVGDFGYEVWMRCKKAIDKAGGGQ